MRTAGRPTRVAPLVLIACSLLSGSACRGREQEPLFLDLAVELGLDFVHESGRKGEFWYVEMMGAGGALFDADGDSDLDVWLAQGGPLDAAGEGPTDRFFRNLLVEEGSLRFIDATAASGLGSSVYSMGAATGDIDGDGDIDLVVTAFGPDRLYRNRGDGTFDDVTSEAGLGDERWTTGAAFLDFDRDGDLDLFVAAYVDFRLGNHVLCRSVDGRPDYCGPQAYKGLSDRLYRNRGDGTFEDLSLQAGIAARTGAGLGVVAADFDGDGWIDLFVANDGEANALWRNRGDGTFEDVALVAGVAVNGAGAPEASMGVVCADLDDDLQLDLFLTHLVNETNTLYLGDGRGNFQDRTAAAGLALPSIPHTGFGAVAIDPNADGRLDLLILNGAVKRIEALASAGDDHPLDEEGQLFLQDPLGRFVEAEAGPGLSMPFVGRGVAVGDLDLDGDEDLLLTGNEGRARLLLRSGRPSDWVGVRTADPHALVTFVLDDGRLLLRRMASDGSYLSASEGVARLLLQGESVDRIEVAWPDGRALVLERPETGRIHAVLPP